MPVLHIRLVLRKAYITFDSFSQLGCDVVNITAYRLYRPQESRLPQIPIDMHRVGWRASVRSRVRVWTFHAVVRCSTVEPPRSLIKYKSF